MKKSEKKIMKCPYCKEIIDYKELVNRKYKRVWICYKCNTLLGFSDSSSMGL